MTLLIDADDAPVYFRFSLNIECMVHTKQRGRRRFVSLTPEIRGIKSTRVIFSILNVIVVTAIIIVLAMTIVAIL